MAAESDGDPRVVGGDAPDPPDHIEQSIREIVRDEQEKQAEEQAEQQGRYLARIGLTRRQVLAIAGGSAFGGTLLSAFSAERARAAATGEIGTAADPLDILYADEVGQSSDPVTTIYTDDLDIGTADFVSSGEFVARLTNHEATDASTASSSYLNYEPQGINPLLQWDVLFPGSQQGQGLLFVRVNPSTDQIDVRLRNVTDGETVVEQTGITGGDQVVQIGPSNYTPTTESSPTQYNIEFRNANNSTSVSILSAEVMFGVGV